jgi:5-methyltetrahydrofolate--homocysteine methyltransferase
LSAPPKVAGVLERLKSGDTLVGDGAWGTQLMARGLGPGESPEAINRSNPEFLAEIASLYVDAGADLVTTNTFGGSSLNLDSYGLSEGTEELNRLAVEAIKPVVEGRAFVSGSVGPSGKILTPYGDTEPEAMAEAFRGQIGALISAGVDVVCVETMIDLREATIAIEAARSIAADVPIFATMTFDVTPRGIFTTMGNSVEQTCSGLAAAGADAVGSNCGNGIEKMIEIAREFAANTSLPIVIQSNAGMPENRNGELIWPETPESMAAKVGDLIDIGVSVIGGCCGTGPDFIKAMKSFFQNS